MKLPSETDLYERYPDLSRLAKALQRAKGEFALFFVECNVATLRRKLASSLADRLQPLPITVDLTTFEGDLQHLYLDELLAARIQDAPADAVVFLFGLEQLLPTQSAERLRATMQQLNWRRSFFSRLQRPLVIWLPQYAINLLAEETPDFYDWYSGVFVFPVDNNTLQQAEKNAFQNLSEQGVHSGDRSSITEKKQWLHTLRSLLEEHSQPDSTLASLLGNIAYLHNSLGNYDQALTYYQQSLAIRQEIGDKKGEGTTLNNISQIFKARGDYDTALDFLKKSLAIQQEIGDVAGLCATLFNMGHIHLQNKEVAEAVQAWVTVYGIAKKINLANVLQALEELAGNIGLEGGLQGWEMLVQQMGKSE